MLKDEYPKAAGQGVKRMKYLRLPRRPRGLRKSEARAGHEPWWGTAPWLNWQFYYLPHDRQNTYARVFGKRPRKSISAHEGFQQARLQPRPERVSTWYEVSPNT